MALSEYVETHLRLRSQYYEKVNQKKLTAKHLIKIYQKALDDAGDEALYNYARKDMKPEEIRQVIDELEANKA